MRGAAYAHIRIGSFKTSIRLSAATLRVVTFATTELSLLYTRVSLLARACNAMHAERDIVLPILSVCLSMPVLYVSKRMDRVCVTLFRRSRRGIILLF